MMLSAAQIVAENAITGTGNWQINGNVSTTIQGYAAQFSVDHGQTVQFKVDTDASDYRIDIYRMGWYQGLGGRLVATVQPTNLQNQPDPIIHLDTNSADASNWHVSASWAVPTNAVSGVYVGKLVREDGKSGENYIIFVVRDDEGHSDLLFQTSDETWEAYNTWGGSSLYSPNYPNGRALAVSYSRPFNTSVDTPLNFYFGEEFAMTCFLERNGFDVSYTTGIDTDRSGSELLEHKVFMSVGHDEYWSGQQRANVEAARDAGVNLAFFSGNEEDPPIVAYRILVCPKMQAAGQGPAAMAYLNPILRREQVIAHIDSGANNLNYQAVITTRSSITSVSRAV